MAGAHRFSARRFLKPKPGGFYKSPLPRLCIWHVTWRLFIVVGFLQLCYGITFERSIILREFSLVTKRGENVLHSNFNRRRLACRSNNRLALTFDAFDQRFEFELERSYPIFAPGARIKMTGRVSARTQICLVELHK